jgi:hypothetical protein
VSPEGNLFRERAMEHLTQAEQTADERRKHAHFELAALYMRLARVGQWRDLLKRQRLDQ